MSRPLLETHDCTASLAVVCTDRGQHKRIRLATVEWWSPRPGVEGEEELMRMPDVGRHWSAPEPNPHGAPMPYEFRCPICRPRCTQVKADRWRRLADAARLTGLDSIDVSHLD